MVVGAQADAQCVADMDENGRRRDDRKPRASAKPEISAGLHHKEHSRPSGRVSCWRVLLCRREQSHRSGCPGDDKPFKGAGTTKHALGLYELHPIDSLSRSRQNPFATVTAVVDVCEAPRMRSPGESRTSAVTLGTQPRGLFAFLARSVGRRCSREDRKRDLRVVSFSVMWSLVRGGSGTAEGSQAKRPWIDLADAPMPWLRGSIEAEQPTQG